MDTFDDILSGAPAAPARPRSKFMPKAKSKQLPQKELSASEHATSSNDGKNVSVASSATSSNSEGILNECHNAVASTLSTFTEDSIRSNHQPQVELPNLEDATNAEMGNPKQDSINRDTIALVDDQSFKIAASEVDADQKFTNVPKSANEADHVGLPDSNKSLEHIDNSLQVIPDASFKSALDNTVAIFGSNIDSNYSAREQEALSGGSEFNPFSDVLSDPGTRNARKFQPKIKPRPRVSNASAIASASSSVMTEKSVQLRASCTSDDILAPAATDTQDPLTLNEDTVFKEHETPSNIRRLETEEVVDLNPTFPIGGIFDYQSIDSVAGPTSEIPVNEELTNAADSPTLADVLDEDVTGEKDANERKRDPSLRKHKRSPTTGGEDKGVKTARQLRKNAARKPVKSSLNEDADDDIDPLYNYNVAELEENDDDEEELDYPSKKKRASSKKKTVANNGKTSQKRKKSTDDLENTTKKPPKKFSHSTRRRKRCEELDKSLLDPENELDPSVLPIKQIILLAEYRERQAKKEGTTSNTSSINQSGGDSFFGAGGSYEEDFFGSEDPNDYEGSEKVTDTSALINYQSFMDKAPRGKWSKQDTELFYEAVREFGTDFSMIQQLFPDRTRHQIKLKYKKEERQHPLQLCDAVNSRSKDLSHFKKVIERLQQASAKAEQDPNEDVSNIMTGEEVEDLAPENNDEVATAEKDTEEVETTKQNTDVIDQEDSAALHNPEQSDDDDDDYSQIWSYTSEFL